MIKRAVLCCLPLLFLIGCYSPERQCSDFRTGTFRFDYSVDGVSKTGRFTRDSLFSVEYYDGKVDTASVRWVNDCEFVLKDLDSKISIHYKILKTTDSSYTFEFRNAALDPSKKYLVKTGTAFKTN